MWAKQSTAATLIVGPILDSTGAEYTSAVIGDLSISKNGGTLTALASAATLTHIANGQYTLVMTTGNLDTLGRLQITCNKSTYQMPPIGLVVVPAMVFDSMVLGTDVLQADVTQFGGTAGTFSGGVPTVVLDSATQTQITAIETFATRITTGIVQDGAVWQFTANMLELGPGGGSSTVTVLPATGIVADRSAGTTLTPVVGETISQAITVYQSDGTTAVDLSGKSLKVIFETMSGTDVAVVNTADITISGTDDNVVTFAYPSAVTASERTLKFAIRDAAAPLTMYLQGVCSVVSAPKVDV